MIKIKELRKKETEELIKLLKELEEKKLALETQRRLKKIVENPGEIRNTKRTIARIKTILNERKQQF
ncbi:MAG: 50S ribosomal protein L29 [Nanoarchaeota archaeon]|jgi:large subunit ribosomal protein L29